MRPTSLRSIGTVSASGGFYVCVNILSPHAFCPLGGTKNFTQIIRNGFVAYNVKQKHSSGDKEDKGINMSLAFTHT